MWIRKRDRDLKKGVDSPLPTQMVSNEEFIPRPQNEQQKQVEALIGEMAQEKARKLNMDRRSFMASSMGLATCFLAQNRVYGKVWDVDEVETFEIAAIKDKFPDREYFVMDVQTHFTNGFALGFRNAEFAKNMGFNLKEDVEAYSFQNYVKELLLDSETEVVVISGVPGKELQRAPDGRVLEGPERTPRFGILPSWLMAQRKKELNELAGATRAFCQGNLAPNHYWDTKTNTMDKAATIEQMEREINLYKVDSWKWYCHTDPARTGNGFQVDDDNAQWFIEESRKRGLKLISVHKGYSYQSRTLGHLANPKDMEKAALRNPDFNFVVYHSALKHGPSEPNYMDANKFDPTTGDFEWHSVLMDIKKRNPNINNLYPEVGSFFNALVVSNPIMCMHGMGKNIKHYGSDHVVWGTDCLWFGSPQWSIDAFKRFQISDEFCEKFGYSKITKEDKAKILGLNAAKLYGYNVPARRSGFPNDKVDQIKKAYVEYGGQRENNAFGWVRAHD